MAGRPLPGSLRMTAGRWARRGLVWLGVLAVFGLLLRYDVALMRVRFDLLGPEPQGNLKQVLFGLRDFGQVVPITVALIIVATYDRRRWTVIGVVLLAQLLASVSYNGSKALVARYRPYYAIEHVAPLELLTTADTWIGWKPGNHDNDRRSFPSGHSGAAFAFGVAMGWFYPPLRWLFWTLAAGCAVSRYLDAVHWPSDCLAGAVIGYVAAWLALRPYVWAICSNQPTLGKSPTRGAT